jgi:serine phosphatase RsbU (regulator of sigma subunit)
MRGDGRGGAGWLLAVLPFALVAGIGIARGIIGPGQDLLPLLVAGPAVAAIVGSVWLTLAAGAWAMAVAAVLDAFQGTGPDHRRTEVVLVATAVITVTAIAAARARERRDAELSEARGIADAVQKVLLRPVPARACGVRLGVSYASASSGARVGGDLYDVVASADRVRVIVGDVQGKGLPALETASAVLGVFREAAHDAGGGLEAVVGRIESTLARELSEEQFVTAVLAEIHQDEPGVRILNCGHPPPLLLGPAEARYAGGEEGSLPLGMTDLGDAPRRPVVLPFGPGEGILLYTDGASEARGRSGDFFALAAQCPLTVMPEPATFVEAVRDKIISHVGRSLDDDMTLLLAYRSQAGA